MARALKVYGWTGIRDVQGLLAREIMAGYSVGDVLRMSGLTRDEYYRSGGETTNEEEIRVAVEEPRTVFFTTLSGNKISGNVWQAVRD